MLISVGLTQACPPYYTNDNLLVPQFGLSRYMLLKWGKVRIQYNITNIPSKESIRVSHRILIHCVVHSHDFLWYWTVEGSVQNTMRYLPHREKISVKILHFLVITIASRESTRDITSTHLIWSFEVRYIGACPEHYSIQLHVHRVYRCISLVGEYSLISACHFASWSTHYYM